MKDSFLIKQAKALFTVCPLVLIVSLYLLWTNDELTGFVIYLVACVPIVWVWAHFLKNRGK